MSYRRIAQTGNMIGGRLWKTAQYYQAVTAACAVVAFGTHGVESLAATGQQPRRQIDRQLRNIRSIR